jgi:hypothetical protein
MKTSLKIALVLLTALTLTSIVVVGQAFNRSRHGWHDSSIIADGPFATRSLSLFPHDKSGIERWFLAELPLGTPRESARDILRKSFSVDLTTGRMVQICASGSLAGGGSTSVQLHFDRRGCFQGVTVTSQYEYL